MATTTSHFFCNPSFTLAISQLGEHVPQNEEVTKKKTRRLVIIYILMNGLDLKLFHFYPFFLSSQRRKLTDPESCPVRKTLKNGVILFFSFVFQSSIKGGRYWKCVDLICDAVLRLF